MSNVYSEDTEKYNLQNEWRDTRKEAYLYDKLPDSKVQCKLCPRNCIISNNHVGFCKVRKNIDGVLYAQSYGKATHVTIEKIETEAIFNYLPGADILSLGNFGCNLDCDYCQNWKYSRFEYTPEKEIHEYTAEQIIDMAKKNNVKVLSWTYNDPAVWYEFVLDVAKEAKKAGIKNLFKSAFFLSLEAVKELCEVIDVFAISIKAINKDYYKKFTKGWLDPILENAKYIYQKNIHLELSNLVVTDLSNNEEEYAKMIDFTLNSLSKDIPLHFTRFHPDYKYTHVEKTPMQDVVDARNLALKMGLKYAYIGNAFEGEGLNTYCPECKELLIQRYGLHTYLKDALSADGKCNKCGCQTNIKIV